MTHPTPDANTIVELAERAEAVGNLPAHLQRGEEGMIDRAIRDLRLVPETRALRRYTSSLDSAMTLAVQGISAPDVLRHAIARCSRYGAPTFIEALPRFVASEWLRARAAAESAK
jgi:hypothetical protein